LRSHETSAWGWLLHKEWRELTTSRSFWVMLALIGPLVGISFINGVSAYAEASGASGSAGGLSDALFPLDGVVAPSFSAYEIAATFLLPFVAIRAIAGDRASGALKLELQQGLSPIAMIAAKALVLGAGWCVAALPLLIAGILWLSYGGSLYPPEIISLLLGHVLHAALIIAMAAAAAALAEHPSTAAILVLAFTVGTWVLSFIAAAQGGIFEQIASFTPSEMLDDFRAGLIRLNLILAGAIIAGTGLAIASVWMRMGMTSNRRALESGVVIAMALIALFGVSFLRASWDVSENERNSLPREERELLSGIAGPVRITAYLAPEDPRRFELERQMLSKLRRTMPNLTVEYVSQSSTGLFEQTRANYGEIHYELGGKSAVGQSVTQEGVLDAIYELAGIQPAKEGEVGHKGHPLAVRPLGAAPLFYVVWPLAVMAFGYFLQRRRFA
jgi:ABC-2 type transport system permease protein